jgi:hypothetical protein
MTQTPPLQPLLHDRMIALRAPVQFWSDHDGTVGTAPIDGVYIGDTRVVDRLRVELGGDAGEHLSSLVDGASQVRFERLHRELDGPGADPDLRSTLTVSVDASGVDFSLRIASRLAGPRRTIAHVELGLDATAMDRIKAGLGREQALEISRPDGAVAWTAGAVTSRLTGAGAAIETVETSTGASVALTWPVELPARGEIELTWRLELEDRAAVVGPATAAAPWTVPSLDGADDRLQRWMTRALDDLDGLRMETTHAPGETFFAAGAPWFFTLFGRDAIWAARLTLPLGHEMSASTLRVLAAFQGTKRDPETAEQPGKIMHELRSAALEIPGEGVVLPPLYYGTVDATPLWITLLHDAWKAGMPDAEVRELLPALEAALAWMRDFGDSDDDGLLEYVDESGRGLANQGWKDSGDSVQWRDGRLAEGPIALCEVQAYAYEAALHGADLLDAFGAAAAGDERSGDEWRAWASRLADAFHVKFWVEDEQGPYVAIALDAAKRPVDSLTSNLGHLLGTGLLDEAQSAVIARRLVSPELASGFGLRTLSTLDAGFWPLSYHGGSVWTHDTAIAVFGLHRAGFAAEASELASGLLAAAPAFDYRMPELHAGDSAADAPQPAPYPASCRPQAWSAAAAVAVWNALRD